MVIGVCGGGVGSGGGEWGGGGWGGNIASALSQHSNTAHMFHIETIALFHWAIWHRFLMFFSADHS